MRFESAVALTQELRESAPRSPPAAVPRRQPAEFVASVLDLVDHHAAGRFPFLGISAARSVWPLAAQRWFVSHRAYQAEVAAAARPALGVARGRRPGDFVIAVRLQSRSHLSQREVERISARTRGEVDVDYIGPIKAYALGVGSSVGRLRPIPTTGSVGCFVDRTGGKGPELLSRNHVLGSLHRGRTGDPVLSPGPADGGGSGDRVATLTKILPIDPRNDNDLDAALAVPDEDLLGDPGLLPGGQRLAEPPPQPLRPGGDVMKVGRSTGATSGQLRAVGVGPVLVDFTEVGGGLYSFVGLLEIRGDGPAAFSSPGDSGALIWEASTGAGVGVLVAGPSSAGSPQGATFATSLSRTIAALGVTLRLA